MIVQVKQAALHSLALQLGLWVRYGTVQYGMIGNCARCPLGRTREWDGDWEEETEYSMTLNREEKRAST